MYEKPTLETRTGDGVAPTSRERRVLSESEAFAFIAGDDRRPLLVMRECLTCAGTDDALLTRRTDNERTLLMSRWFRCVKLPPDVLGGDHPFHALFAGQTPGHLFLARWDGSGRRDLDGAQSRTELWSLMDAALKADYADAFQPRLKQLQGLLGELDELDAEIGETRVRIDDEIEDGASDAKIAKLRKKVEDLVAEKDAVAARVHALSQLALRRASAAGKREDVPEPPARRAG